MSIGRRVALYSLAATACAVAGAFAIAAPPASSNAARPVSRTAQAEDEPRWSALSPAQREALKPLERDWSTIDAPRKAKWLDLASRMPKMPAEQRARIQQRMSEWARLSPQERGRARINYQEAAVVAPVDRKAQWEAYQALPPEEKQRLAQRADANGRAASAPREGSRPTLSSASTQKSNVVPNPSQGTRLKPVTPSLVQAQPGATTRLISRRPTPPAHQQIGLPKIAATPELVDPATLLPQRGPQGAASLHPLPSPDNGS